MKKLKRISPPSEEDACGWGKCLSFSWWVLFADKYETVEVCEGEATKWFMETEGAHRVREYREWFGKNPSMDAMMRLWVWDSTSFFIRRQLNELVHCYMSLFYLLLMLILANLLCQGNDPPYWYIEGDR